jgi:cell division transport system permease protein
MARGWDRTAIALAATALTFALLGAGVVVDRNVAAAVAQARTATKVVAYLRPGASADDIARVAEAARAIPGVEDVRAIEPAEALEEFKAAIGPDDPIFEALGGNPLPAYVEATPAVEDPSAVAEALAAIEGVEEVDYGRRTAARLARIAAALRTGGLAVCVGLAVFALLVIAALEGLAAYARRVEIAVMRLLGADDSAVLAPFWIEGAILGGVGAAAGLLIDLALFRAVVERLPEIAFRPVFLEPGAAAAIVMAGVAMGALGGIVAALRFLRAEAETG